MNGEVVCAIEYDGKLIIGGSFSRVGAVNADNLAAWDGAKWSPLGGGADSRVEALHIFEGDLIIGGYFNHAGGVAARGVARWNGSEWLPFGPGLGAPYYPYYDENYHSPGARAFATYKGALIAGGDFTSTGNFPLEFMAQWNGSAWVPVAYGIDGPVHALAVVGDTLYFGGAFRRAGFTTASAVARWDGSTSSPLGMGLNVEYEYGRADVHKLLPWRGMIVANGYFQLADSTEVYGLAVWNGSSWEAIGSGSGGWASSMALDGDDLVVGTNGSVQRWDGNTWSEYAPGLWGQPDCLAPYGSHLFAAGAIRAVDPNDWSIEAVGMALSSNGTWAGVVPWTDHMRGLSGGSWVDVFALETYQNQLIALGEFYMSGDPPHWADTRIMAAWDGTSWSQFPLPTNYGWWARALLAHEDSLYLAGEFYEYGSPPKRYPVLKYDGATWTPLDTLSLRATAIAIYNGELYVAGIRTLPDSYRAEIHRWAGEHWEIVGFGVGFQSYSNIETMVVHEGKLIVGGSFQGISNVPAPSVAAWDGSHWGSVGSGFFSFYDSPAVRSLAVHRGNLIASGYFPYRGGVMQLNGTRWSPMGDVYAAGVALASIGGELYLGGQILWSDGRNRREDGVARWDGREWEPMGSGTNDQVSCLKPWKESLYLGGRFTRAGSGGSFGVARWDGLASVLGAPRVTLAPGVPNPFRVRSTFHYRLAVAGPVRVSVYDVRGREVKVLQHEPRPAGDQIIWWDGTARDGSPMPSGIYYVRVLLPGGIEKSQKTIFLR